MENDMLEKAMTKVMLCHVKCPCCTNVGTHWDIVMILYVHDIVEVVQHYVYPVMAP